MDFFGLVLSALLLVGMFVVLRRIERWFHQHIFKVGWLVTQNYQTTTILYYTFFFPGVLLHEVIYWLAAGIFNVRAEQSLQFPEAQEVGELKLNFVQLHSQASRYRKAIIGLVPLLAGIALVWFITDRVFDLPTIVQIMSTGELSDLVAALQQFLNTPDFWLWMYIAFTIGNTMFPTDTRYTKEWRRFGIGAAAIISILAVIGLGTELYEAAAPALTRLVNVLHLTVILLIGIDVVMVLGLGLIEYIIERVTDRSATFRNGKMYTMSRQEAIAEREHQRELAERRQRRREREREQAAQTGPQTVYALSFSIPGAPDTVSITQPQVEMRSEQTTSTDADVAELPQETAEEMAGRIRIPQREKPPAPPEDIMSEATDTAPPDDDRATEYAPPEDSLFSQPTANDAVSSPEVTPVPPEDITPETAAPEDITIDEADVEDASATDDSQEEADATSDITATDDNPAVDFENEDVVDEDEKEDADGEIEDTPDVTEPVAESDTTADDTDTEIASDDQKAATELPKPRRTTSPFSRPTTSADDDSSDTDAVAEEDAPSEPVIPASSPFKRFGTAAQQSSTSDDSSEDTTSDDTPAPAKAQRFGIKSFDANTDDTDDSDDTDENKPTFARRASLRTRSTSPFRSLRPRYDADDDDSDADDESILRSTRDNNAVSDLFKGLSSRRLSDADSDTDAEETDVADDEAVTEDTPPLDLRGLGRPLTPPSVSFGKPRPAPKPTADDESDADDSDAAENDFIEYEYEDVDDYRDYDDDDL